MPKLPTVSGTDAIKVFESFGFVVDRIKGSHHVMKREGHKYALSIPVHGSTAVAKGTLRSLIDAAGITVQEFLDAT